MAMNRSYDPPVSNPPDTPPRTILQIDTQTDRTDFGYIGRLVRMATPKGGVPLQRTITGKSDGPDR